MGKKKSKNTVQDLIGIETFTKRGIKAAHGELVYYLVPGLMLAMQEHYHFSDAKIIQALFNASAIGSA